MPTMQCLSQKTRSPNNETMQAIAQISEPVIPLLNKTNGREQVQF
ncbi:hypothetical protein [Listeria booriae]|nr:hypothetical protein [Listeria booriae]